MGFRRYREESRGASSVEYGALAGLIAAVSVGALLTVGGEVENLFDVADEQISSAVEVTTSPGGDAQSGASDPSFEEACGGVAGPCPDGQIYAGRITCEGTTYDLFLAQAAHSPHLIDGWDGQEWSNSASFWWTEYELNDPGRVGTNGTNIAVSGAGSLCDGPGNTAALKADEQSSRVDGTIDHEAMRMCDGSTAHGHDDWYLPAVDEMLPVREAYINDPNLDVADLTTWTSTQESWDRIYLWRWDDYLFPSRRADNVRRQTRCMRRIAVDG